MLHTGNASSRWLTIHNPPLFARKTSLRLSSMATLVTPSNVLTEFGCCGSDRSIRRTVSVGSERLMGLAFRVRSEIRYLSSPAEQVREMCCWWGFRQLEVIVMNNRRRKGDQFQECSIQPS